MNNAHTAHSLAPSVKNINTGTFSCEHRLNFLGKKTEIVQIGLKSLNKPFIHQDHFVLYSKIFRHFGYREILALECINYVNKALFEYALLSNKCAVHVCFHELICVVDERFA